MATHYARNAYLQAKVQPETNPKRLILMLYEGALEDLRLAKEAIEQQHARQRGEHLSRAAAIVLTLLTSLDSNVTDEPIAFLRGLYQAILVALSQVAITHDVKVLELAFRYLERLKQIWEQDVMGLQVQTSEVWQQGAQQVALSEAAHPVVAQRSAYGHASPLAAQRTVSV
jgi:flagellar secretion chaperone FliS